MFASSDPGDRSGADGVQDSREERRQALKEQIAVRLSRVRGGLTDGEFAELVESVVQTAERFREIEAKPVTRGADDAPGAPGISRED